MKPKVNWDEAAARHLLSRACFGGTPEQAKALAASPLEKAVENLLDDAAKAEGPPHPEWVRDVWVNTLRRYSDMPREEYLVTFRRTSTRNDDELLDLKARWLRHMVTTPAPLRENLTLFWHGHFTSASRTMFAVSQAFYHQNETWRKHAIGHGIPDGYCMLSFQPVEAQASIDEPIPAVQTAKAVVREGEVERTCSFGHRHVTYKIGWRDAYVPVLKLLAEGVPMTTAEVGDRFSGAMAATVRKCPSELLHFDLLEVVGRRGRNLLYHITERGQAFLRGTLAVPICVWPKGVELPKECVPGPGRYLHDLTGDRQEEAVSA